MQSYVDELKPRQAPVGPLTGVKPEGMRPLVFWLAFAGVCLLGLLLRLPTLASKSLWLDEAFSAWFSARPLHELWTDVPRYELHPPMYYTLLKGWSDLFGTSESALRSLSVSASVLTIVVVARAGTILRFAGGGDAVALAAALLLAVNAGSIKYAQEARPYALESLFATIAVLSAMRLLQSLTRERVHFSKDVLLTALVLGVSTGAAMWMHDTAVVIAYGIGVGMVATLLVHAPAQRGRQALILGGAGLVAIAIWSPMLPMLAMQSANLASIPFWVSTRASDVLDAWSLVTGGGKSLLICLGSMILAGLFALWRRRRPAALYLTIVLFLPLASILLVSVLVKPIFIARIFEWLTPAAMILAAGAMLGLPSRAWRIGAFAVILGLSAKATLASYRLQQEDWRGIVQVIASQAKPGDLVIGIQNGVGLAIDYYARGQAFPEVLYLPGPFPARGLHREYIGNLGMPRINAEDIATEHAHLAHHGRVWLVERNAPAYDPGDLVRAEVAAHFTLRKRTESGWIVYELYD